MSDLDQMQIEWWEVDRPKPYERNPRQITQEAIEKVAASIEEFGWRQPIVVDEQGVIIVGHTRLLAAKFLKRTHVPVLVATGLTPEQVMAYRLADNRTGEETDWDQVLLGRELAALKALKYDLSRIAFNEMEIIKAIGIANGQGVTGDPQREWRAMPEYVRGEEGMFKTILLHFPDQEAMEAFSKLVDQPITMGTKYLWYPKQVLTNPVSRTYVVESSDA